MGILASISSDIWPEIQFYSNTWAEPWNVISESISNNYIPPQMKILNIIIPILMHFCSFVSNWSFTSHIMLRIIQWHVTKLMTSNCFLQYITGLQCRKFLTLSNQKLRYKSKCIRIIIVCMSYLEFLKVIGYYIKIFGTKILNMILK